MGQVRTINRRRIYSLSGVALLSLLAIGGLTGLRPQTFPGPSGEILVFVPKESAGGQEYSGTWLPYFELSMNEALQWRPIAVSDARSQGYLDPQGPDLRVRGPSSLHKFFFHDAAGVYWVATGEPVAYMRK